MMTLPDVGRLTAISFMATIENPYWFRSQRYVGAHLDINPRRDQSGKGAINGRISKRVDRLTRKLLFEAANDPWRGPCRCWL